MAPVKDGVGQSEYTQTKQELFKSILDMHIAVTMAVLRKHPFYRQSYLFVDATAGPGIYGTRQNRFIGSPLIFLQSADKSGLGYNAHFIEESPRNVRILSRLLSNCRGESVTIYEGNYENILPSILTVSDATQLGMLYIDPNGIPDWDPIVDVVNRYPRLDLLIHISATSVKRVPQSPSLEEAMSNLGKSNWLIRRPIRSDKNQWTFLLGSNAEIFKTYSRIQFFPLTSPAAQEFFPRIALTKQEWERLGQASFWDVEDEL